MGGKKFEISPEDYIFAAIQLFMDIVYIFWFLLQILGGNKWVLLVLNDILGLGFRFLLIFPCSVYYLKGSVVLENFELFLDTFLWGFGLHFETGI